MVLTHCSSFWITDPLAFGGIRGWKRCNLIYPSTVANIQMPGHHQMMSALTSSFRASSFPLQQ